MRRTIVFALFAFLALLTAGTALAGNDKGKGKDPGHKAKHPGTIALPTGWRPEGIAIKGNTVYVGSIPTGAVWKGNLHTGQGTTLVQPQTGRAAIGIKVSKNRLWVAGGGTGQAYLYDATTGASLGMWQLTTSTATFINDVVVTKRAIWFTDSQQAQLYRLPLGADGALPAQADVQTLPLTGDFVQQAGFNLNGIAAVPGGRWLIVVQSPTGKLFRVDTTTGATKEIVLAKGETVVNGDGILLIDHTLYVVQNRLNAVAVVKLGKRLETGVVKTRLTNPALNVPTTVASHGKFLYTVNAKFGIETPDTQPYEIVKLKKPHKGKGHTRGHK